MNIRLEFGKHPETKTEQDMREQQKREMEIVKTIIEQLGGLGIQGALCWVGAKDFTIIREGEEYGRYRLAAFACRVNGGNRRWHMCVELNPSDTYTITLWDGKQQLDIMEDVYADVLQDVFKDTAVLKYFNGVIPGINISVKGDN